MIEILCEYAFSVMDYTYILLAFLLLEGQKIKFKKYILPIMIVALIQQITEIIELPVFILSLKDGILIIFFLLINERSFKKINFLHALMIDSLFALFLTLGITIATLCSIDIMKTLDFGLYRLCFVIVLKVFVCLCLMVAVTQFKKIRILISQKNYTNFISCFIICEFLTSLILQVSNQMKMKYFMVVLIGITCLALYLLINYSIIMKKNYDIELYKKMSELTEDQMQDFIIEQMTTRKFIHDTKNVFLDIYIDLDHHSYDLAKEKIQKYLYESSSLSYQIKSANVYLDLVVRQKENKYPDCEIILIQNVPENILIDSKDMIMVLTLLLDEICPNIISKQLELKIQWNGNELSIRVRGIVKKPETILQSGSFNYDFFQNIVGKYEGDLQIHHSENFECLILLFATKSPV